MQYLYGYACHVRVQLVLPDTLEHFYTHIIYGKRLYASSRDPARALFYNDDGHRIIEEKKCRK